jgi:hypothetical protein
MIDRREFCRSLAAMGTTTALLGLVEVSGQASSMDLEEATIGDLQLGMQKGTMTSASITAWYIARIKSHDRETNSIIEINPEALSDRRRIGS